MGKGSGDLSEQGASRKDRSLPVRGGPGEFCFGEWGLLYPGGMFTHLLSPCLRRLGLGFGAGSFSK